MKSYAPPQLRHTPLGIVTRLAMVVLASEFLIMLLIRVFLEPMLGDYVSDNAWNYLDALLLAVTVVPALFYLVLRPMKQQQLVLEQQNIELNQLTAQLREDEALLQSHHQQTLDNLQHMIEVEKLSSLGIMVGGVAHEINNPLMGIMNYVEYARDKAADPKSQEVLNNALHEIHRIKKIVSNMLIFIRPKDTQRETCSVQETVTRTLALLEGELRKNAIETQVDIAANLPQLECDAGCLQQVLVNLLLNARDAMAGQAEQRIRITACYDQEQITLSICDTGPGIPVTIRNRIFDPFFTTKSVGKGTGLGLSVSKHLLHAEGATINLHQEHGYGCCFRVVFAVAKKTK